LRLGELRAELPPPEPQDGLTDPDAVPEPPAEPVTKPGDVWVMGEHRLLCGDSTKAECVETLMQGEKAGLCFTSPPYAQQRDYTEASDCTDWDGLMQGVFGVLPMTDDGQVLVNLGLIHRDGEWVPYWDGWIEWMREQGWRRFGWYVWDQGHGLRGDWNGRLAPSHEWVFHFNQHAVSATKWVDAKHAGEQGGVLRNAAGGFSDVTDPTIQDHKIPDSVIRAGRQKGGIAGHPAPFSVALAEHVVQSWPGDTYEPFSGSGTTIIACEQLGRKARAIEIAPVYVDVAVRRWQQFTGKQAVNEATGELFPEVTA